MSHGRWRPGEVMCWGKPGGAGGPSFIPNFKARPPRPPPHRTLTRPWPGGCGRDRGCDRGRGWKRERPGQREDSRAAPSREGRPGARTSRAAAWPFRRLRGRPPLPNGRRGSGPSAGYGVPGPRPPAPAAPVSSLAPRPPAGVRPLAVAVGPRDLGRWWRGPAVSPPARVPSRRPVPSQGAPAGVRGAPDGARGDSGVKFSGAGRAAPTVPGAAGTPPPARARAPPGAAGPLTHPFPQPPQGCASTGALRHLQRSRAGSRRRRWGPSAQALARPPRGPGPWRRGAGRGGAQRAAATASLGLAIAAALLFAHHVVSRWAATTWCK